MEIRDTGPLLFVDSPPVHFISEPVYSKEWLAEEEKLDESTSVYTLPGKTEEAEKVLAQLRFLSRPFQRQAYRPIQFRLKDGGAVTGDIERLEDGMVHIRNAVEAGDSREIPVHALEAIWWKGKPFPRS
ncbi:hypothetical protein [Edaphobacillus lindanitolerans]|uniref:YolD-like protein n=1 Tax=Edaphobacillus lindanitolerans TaxID=550447 RepID=A0A1U7PM04_9BACI|nr:hypothetical protein [Edaphobacillus lindanitolerans]SIT68704.1 hypothetical protein SAMN05428946_0399 [Edaphobacillus lindanitolerans]